MQILTAKDLSDLHFKRVEEKNRRVKIEDGFVVLDGHYEISLKRVATEQDVLKWLNHLMHKIWFDKDIAMFFIETVCDHNNIVLHPLP